MIKGITPNIRMLCFVLMNGVLLNLLNLINTILNTHTHTHARTHARTHAHTHTHTGTREHSGYTKPARERRGWEREGGGEREREREGDIGRELSFGIRIIVRHTQLLRHILSPAPIIFI